jgi:hypothetical protein
LKSVLKLCFVSTIILLCSCAAPEVKIPTYEGMDVTEGLRLNEHISAIEAELSIIFKKEGASMRGEGVVNISKNGDLTLRVYSLGFLAFELTSDHGSVKSDPALDRTKRKILTSGLRDCLFWWDMDKYDVAEEGDVYLLRSFPRKIWIDRKTMLPVQQSVQLDDDRELWFYYEKPEKMGGIWFPSKVRIELSRYAVILEFDEMLFISEDSMGRGVRDSSEKNTLY